MSLMWKGEAKCGTFRPAGGCANKCEVIFTLEAERKITVKAPEGWVVYTRGYYDSQRDTSQPEPSGDDYQVRCPEHAEENY